MSSFMKRTLTSIGIVLALVGLYFIGNEAFSVFMASLTLYAIYELKKAFSNININIYFVPIEIILLISIMTSFLNLSESNILSMISRNNILICSIICFIVFVFDLSDKKLENLGSSMITIIYIYGLGRIFYTYSFYNLYAYIFIIAVTSGTDVFAYLGGSTLGKHKLMPKISPKKTIEGAIFGLIGAIVCGVIISKIFLAEYIEINLYFLIVLLILGVLAELGDLFASAIKRTTKIKDFSNLLPGHGGILDRLDSLLFVASAVNLLCHFVF